MAGDVGGIGGAGRARRAERPLRDLPVLGARENRSPALELVDVAGRLVAEDLDRVLVAEVVGALDRVEGVLLRTVLGRVSERGVDPTFGRARVAPDRVDLGEERDVRALVESLDGRAHPGATGPDDKHVVLRFHQATDATRVKPGADCRGQATLKPRAGRGELRRSANCSKFSRNIVASSPPARRRPPGHATSSAARAGRRRRPAPRRGPRSRRPDRRGSRRRRAPRQRRAEQCTSGGDRHPLRPRRTARRSSPC